MNPTIYQITIVVKFIFFFSIDLKREYRNPAIYQCLPKVHFKNEGSWVSNPEFSLNCCVTLF